VRAGDIVLRNIQHYLRGALNEDAEQWCLLAVARAIDQHGAKTAAEALGHIFHTYLKATEKK
jgi:hypothetical protein